MGVPAKSSKVARYTIVGIVAPHLRNQLGMLLGDRQMSVCPPPVADRLGSASDRPMSIGTRHAPAVVGKFESPIPACGEPFARPATIPTMAGRRHGVRKF